MVGWGGGGVVRNISSPLSGGIKYFPTLFFGGAGVRVPNFMVEFWNTLHTPQYTYFMTGPLAVSGFFAGSVFERRLSLPEQWGGLNPSRPLPARGWG